MEYDEDIMVSSKIVRIMDLERMKKVLWIPFYSGNDQAEVIACNPDASCIVEVKQTLNVKIVSFFVALPADIIRIIKNNLDLNPNFCV